MSTVHADRAGPPAEFARRTSSGEVIRRLLRAAAHVAAEQSRRLRATTLSPSAFNVLLELADARDGRLQPCALADRLAVSRPSMCGLIDGLQAKGLVTRAPHLQDGRRVLVELSPAGRKLLDDHRAGHDALHDTVLDGLTDRDRQHLVALLQRIGP